MEVEVRAKEAYKLGAEGVIELALEGEKEPAEVAAAAWLEQKACT